MKFVKSFELFETRDDSETYSELIEKIPGKNEFIKTFIGRDDKPAVVFKIDKNNLKFWMSIGELDSPKKAIRWINDEIDDMLWGFDDEQKEFSAMKNSFYKIVDFSDDSLKHFCEGVNRLGLIPDIGYLSINKDLSTKRDHPAVLIRFVEDKEQQYKYRGNIASKKFGQ